MLVSFLPPSIKHPQIILFCIFFLGEQSVLLSQVLADISLSESNHTSGVQTSDLERRLCGDTESQRRIAHGVDNDSSMLGNVVTHLSNVGLENVVTVKEGHLSVGLDPDLVSSVCGKKRQSGDVKSELAGLGELAETGADREELGSRHTGGILGNLLLNVVDSVLLEPEHVRVFVIDEVRDVSTNVVGKLLEHGFRFFFGKRSHCVWCMCRC